jgi:hypothetical protein
LKLVPILSQVYPVHIVVTYFSKIHFNIILYLNPGLLSGFYPSRFLSKMLYALLTSPTHATCPTSLIHREFVFLGYLSSTTVCNWHWKLCKIWHHV